MVSGNGVTSTRSSSSLMYPLVADDWIICKTRVNLISVRNFLSSQLTQTKLLSGVYLPET
ncbi:hypothetical protein [Heliothis virescens ascovirus 3e]|uniref:Uncharacterized protein n=1 Tax=Heliothis virescens ascovirus 3e TaxID=260797 RepID=A4KXK1_HVAVE|nr:hypothetical protein HVAV3e_gp145 [Heliothis virescens ascovirus 3e]ABO37332.1 hypothetical protein [Heliothis virescens ascovirus 3e]